MRVYHGSLERVEMPRILAPARRMDYGSGFYATSSERQAAEWAERRMEEKSLGTLRFVDAMKIEGGACSK